MLPPSRFPLRARAEPSRAHSRSELEPASSFLVGTPGEHVVMRSLDGRSRSVVPEVSWRFCDPSHGLSWFLESVPSFINSNPNLGAYVTVWLPFQTMGTEVSFCF